MKHAHPQSINIDAACWRRFKDCVCRLLKHAGHHKVHQQSKSSFSTLTALDDNIRQDLRRKGLAQITRIDPSGLFRVCQDLRCTRLGPVAAARISQS